MSTAIRYPARMSETQGENTFGLWLDEVLSERDMTRQELAYKTGFSKGTIDAWIGGRRQIKERSADKIADFFEIDRAFVRELAGRRPPLGSAAIATRHGSNYLSGLTQVAFVPVIGTAPASVYTHSIKGGAMPFVPRYLADYKDPGAVMITDDSYERAGFSEGDWLFVEQSPEEEPDHGDYMVAEKPSGDLVVVQYIELASGSTLVPVSQSDQGKNMDDLETVGIVRASFTVRSV